MMLSSSMPLLGSQASSGQRLGVGICPRRNICWPSLTRQWRCELALAWHLLTISLEFVEVPDFDKDIPAKRSEWRKSLKKEVIPKAIAAVSTVCGTSG